MVGPVLRSPMLDLRRSEDPEKSSLSESQEIGRQDAPPPSNPAPSLMDQFSRSSCRSPWEGAWSLFFFPSSPERRVNPAVGPPTCWVISWKGQEQGLSTANIRSGMGCLRLELLNRPPYPSGWVPKGRHQAAEKRSTGAGAKPASLRRR